MSVKVARLSPSKLKGRPGVLVQFPWDPIFGEQLQAMVPRSDRWWNHHRKGWWIAESHVDVVTHLLRGAFPAVEIFGTDGRSVILEKDQTIQQEQLL